MARHRLVHSLVSDELSSRIHAFQLTTLAPFED
ncbi:MAG: BolA/IbaG family iron-sulfur metabolism protein [Rhodospirillaceae bacterium]